VSQEQPAAPGGYSLGGAFERIAKLEQGMVDVKDDIRDVKVAALALSDQTDKIKTRLTLATGLILGASVVLKIIPPEIGELLKHALGG
jgi:flavorubredoxin